MSDEVRKNTITTDVIPLFCLMFNNNCTVVHVIDAIEGVYVGNDNAAIDTNEQGVQKGTLQKLHRNHIEIDRKLLNQEFPVQPTNS